VLDEWLAAYDLGERHELLVAADRPAVRESIDELDLLRVPIVAALFAARSLPALLTDRGWRDRPRRLGLHELTARGFRLLADRDDGIVLGLAGRFWTARGGIVPLAEGEFERFDGPGHVRCAWSIELGERDGDTLLATETRVAAADDGAREKMARYWRVIGPFSGLVRLEMLRAIARRAERANTRLP
jgi:hypothetical protein